MSRLSSSFLDGFEWGVELETQIRVNARSELLARITVRELFDEEIHPVAGAVKKPAREGRAQQAKKVLEDLSEQMSEGWSRPEGPARGFLITMTALEMAGGAKGPRGQRWVAANQRVEEMEPFESPDKWAAPQSDLQALREEARARVERTLLEEQTRRPEPGESIRSRPRV